MRREFNTLLQSRGHLLKDPLLVRLSEVLKSRGMHSTVVRLGLVVGRLLRSVLLSSLVIVV